MDYLDEELDFYLHFDYLSLNNMPDYENDLYAAALLNQELTGTEPVSLSSGCFDSLEMRFPEEGIYGYLAFEYQVPKEGNLSVIINNETGDPLDCFISEVSSTDGGWHQQVINLTGIHNPCSVAFQSAGGASFRQAALY
ncbi:MAG: hypothetical protein K6C12_05385 [Oscillospiraceae bacterium]|nr:hypothetical protein [Oscillospiraceae bacterium]